MSANQILLFIIIMSVVALFGLVFYVQTTKKRRQKQSGIIHYKTNKKNHVYFLYRVYTKTPILNRYFKKVMTRLESTYPADRIAVNVKATKDMTYATGAALAAFVVFILLGRNDPFFLGMGIVLTYVLFTQLLTIRAEQLERKIDLQFADFLTDVRHYYHDTGDVTDAVYCTLDEVPYELGLHINKIYTILQSTHTDKEVEKYTDVAPNRFLMMFATICSTIKEYGDKKLPDGQWMFLKNLNHVKEELNVEILKKKRNNYLFSGLKFIAIAPVFLLKPIEYWAIGNMPEMSDFYTGGAGTIVMAITFALTLLSYQMVSNLRDGRNDEVKDEALINKISEIPPIKRLLTLEVNRNYSKSLRYGDELKQVGENIGPRGFLLKRIIYGIAIAIAFNVVVIFAQHQKEDNLLNDFSKAYENSLVPSSEYRENMREISKEYIGQVRKMDDYESQRGYLTKEISEKAEIKESFAKDIVDEIFKRVSVLKTLFYKWYFLIGTVLAFILGFYIPFFILKYQISIMKMSMEDEVVQFQTLALILMNVDGVTINTILEWMEKFAFCFKVSISECIVNLEYSVQKSLQKMKDSEPFPPFKRFVDNLLSIDNVGVVSAFDEIESEREFYKKKREQDNEMIMSKKSEIGKLIAFVPLIGAIGGYMIFPFLQMAFSMLSTMADAISSL